MDSCHQWLQFSIIPKFHHPIIPLIQQSNTPSLHFKIPRILGQQLTAHHTAEKPQMHQQ